MNYQDKNKEELINDLQDLQQKYESIVELYKKEIFNHKQKEVKLRSEIAYNKSVINAVVDTIYVFNPKTGEPIF